MTSLAMENETRLHVAMIPWLAMGHLIPFLEFSKRLAQKGIQISFISTPRNIERLPKIPSNLSSLITLVKLPLPQVENLPEYAESTADLQFDMHHYLKEAFDGLQGSVASFLENSVPNWIIYDFAAHWLPPIANRLGVPCAFFSLLNAAALSWIGPPSVLLGITEDPRKTLEDLLSVPTWIPFPSNVACRLYEFLRFGNSKKDKVSGVTEGYRFGASGFGSDVVFIRTCPELESDYLNLLEEDLYKKPVMPLGLLPPSVEERSDGNGEKWGEISEWLDKQKQESVVYVALGTEADLTQEELTELALGLEQSQLPFFWVMRNLPSSPGKTPAALPDGFEDRILGRGVVCKGWAPQIRILAHPSVSGFVTHCGWNSTIESLALGRVLILLPCLSEQGLNARTLEERKIGLEIPRDERDGSFTRDAVATTLRKVMVDEEGEIFRTKAKEAKEIFGNKDLHDGYINNVVHYLRSYKVKDSQN